MSNPARTRSGWVLGPWADLLIFSGPVLVGLGLIALAHSGGFLHTPMPPWAFALLIVGCDVSHVWATAFRVYLDPEVFRRRPGLYLGIPLACLGVGILLYSASANGALFWRVLAYLAAFHFVRQQWGWVAYARHRAGESNPLDRRLDQLAIYNATLFPLLWWHARLPRAFDWFVAGDFASGLPPWASQLGQVAHWSINALYLARQLWLFQRGRGVNWAKLQIWVTTWIAWYGGIVVLNSDLAFTALNVLSHGVPYLAVVWAVEGRRWKGERGFPAALFRGQGWLAFLGLLLLAGFCEEWAWDRLVWHEHAGLFPGVDLELPRALMSLLVPLLALPQATHYVLDGWIWRVKRHAELKSFLESE